MDSKLIVIAIGGNSLIEDSKHVTVSAQYEAAAKTAHHIARLVKEGHRVVIAHGNGPQVGYILLRAEYARKILHTVPLDSCVADTQGAIGYQLQRALDNEFAALGIKQNVATVVTQVEVDPKDKSFENPTKPIGSFMSQEEAMGHKEKDGWSIMEDAGRGYRRVVASPKPKKIVELDTIKTLLDNNIIVIAAGGGGIPVVRAEDGTLSGKEAVIDKDLAAAILAKDLKADMFVISTAVERVCLNYGKPDQKELKSITIPEIDKYIEEGHFAPGSMLPKIQAIRDFVSSTGGTGLITDPAHLYDALYNGAGTKVVS
ncbi:MAG: carbamate kinase [Spirochaetales bacterium]|uniref:carbamate kinase n=1 Tax=Bullifex sp. TaxID=2815808 RepID=UPI002A51D758|nr:carbamate kinase [Bullifex sp.]MDD5972542.1 carbamate kinase [Spirochaetales bacterium]MDD7270300.1 carbamate kinase [Spirochaetales bacterium]MDY4066207.1 carbamate kinase [Bullifex sp.]